MTETLKAVFRYMKRSDSVDSWQALRDRVFAPLFHPEMRFVDVVHVLMSVYTEALMEPRFELPGRHNAAEDLVLAPIKGSHAIEFMGPSDLARQYSVEQFYGAMISKMLCDLRLCRVDWCADELLAENNKTARPHQPALES